MKRNVLLGLVVLMCWSCSKDEYTKPVGINLQMEIENHEVGITERVEVNSIHIEEGRYLLSEVEFKGYRESGEDYFFEKEFEQGLEAPMAAGMPYTAFYFDMPQGLYERISISLKVKKGAGGDQTDDDGDDNGDDDENDDENDSLFDKNASLILYGTYTNARAQRIPLIFVYNYDDTFDYTAKAANAEEVIMVGNDQQVSASLRFNPSHWLQLINSRMLESADLKPVNGVETIILSEEQNSQIFDVLASRIKSASALSFE